MGIKGFSLVSWASRAIGTASSATPAAAPPSSATPAAAPPSMPVRQTTHPVPPINAQRLLAAAKSLRLNGLVLCSCDKRGASVPGSNLGNMVHYGNEYNYSSGKPSVLFDILANHSSLNQVVPLLYNQFESLGRRLRTLDTNRAELERKYIGYSKSFLAPIDDDICRISQLGMQLAALTIRFFDSVEPKLVELEQKKDVLVARKEALAGLKDFCGDIDEAHRMVAKAGSDASFTDLLTQIDRAVRDLEKAVHASNERPYL